MTSAPAVPILGAYHGSHATLDVPCFLVARNGAEWAAIREAAAGARLHGTEPLPDRLPDGTHAVAIFAGSTARGDRYPAIHAAIAGDGRLSVLWGSVGCAAAERPGAFTLVVLPDSDLPVVFARRDAAPAARIGSQGAPLPKLAL